jgi:hypothetical protein
MRFLLPLWHFTCNKFTEFELKNKFHNHLRERKNSGFYFTPVEDGKPFVASVNGYKGLFPVSFESSQIN